MDSTKQIPLTLSAFLFLSSSLAKQRASRSSPRTGHVARDRLQASDFVFAVLKGKMTSRTQQVHCSEYKTSSKEYPAHLLQKPSNTLISPLLSASDPQTDGAVLRTDPNTNYPDDNKIKHRLQHTSLRVYRSWHLSKGGEWKKRNDTGTQNWYDLVLMIFSMLRAHSIRTRSTS